jgi:hypothetical protein
MNDEIHWNTDRDPPLDEALGRVLRAGGAGIPSDVVDWQRLRGEILRRAMGGGRSRDWWEFVAQWGAVAAAASLGAILLSGLLLWQVVTGSGEAARAAPESIAIARVATAYPDETVFSSLVQTEHSDEFTAWGTR